MKLSVVAAAMLCLSPGAAMGVINVNFTPVHLARQSEPILYLQVDPPAERGQMPAKVLKVVKGNVPADGLALYARDEGIVAELRKGVFADGGQVPGMVFFGSAGGTGGAKAGLPAALPQTGLLSLGGHWYGLLKAPRAGAWVLAKDTRDMKAVWDGRTDMLLLCIQYVLKDADPDVPVRADVAWGAKVKIGQVPGAVRSASAVDLAGDPGGPGLDLFVASEGGDRVFRYSPKTRAFEDATAALKLASKSVAAAFGDFNADGRADIASWDGRALTLWQQSAAGTFETKLAAVELKAGCLGLSVLDVGVKGRAGIVVATKGDPWLVRPGEGGAYVAGELAEAKGASAGGEKLGPSAATLVADFDGDGLADIVQAFGGGGLFYKGKGGGAFAAPTACGKVACGEPAVSACTGDFDADGRLDVAFIGQAALTQWRSLGAGQFEQVRKTGDPDYVTRKDITGGGVCDINNDGRQDLLVLYGKAAPEVFFNRGFACLALAAELEMKRGSFFSESDAGQQAGTIADLNHDGAQDLAVVLSDGTVWVVPRLVKGAPGLCVQASVAPSEGCAGPLTVTGWDEGACLGAWSVRPSGPPAFFGKRSPGAIKLKWQFPGGTLQEKEVAVEEGPVRVFLARQGTVKGG